MSLNPKVSIIFPVKNEGDNVKRTLESLFSVKTHQNFEVIIVDDASTDGCCDFLKNFKNKKIFLFRTEGIGAANARNYGAEKAVGKYLVFCDAHIQYEDWWLDRILQPIVTKASDAVAPAIGSIENPSFIGYGQTLKFNMRIKWNQKRDELFEVPILPGACFIIPKKIFHKIGGFEKGFKRWGYEDVEFSLRMWLFGYRCHCEPNVKVLHLFRTKQPYEISYDDIYFNLLRMAYSHFNINRIKKCLKLIPHERSLQIENEVTKSDVHFQRQKYMQKRTYSDDWFFHKFNINF